MYIAVDFDGTCTEHMYPVVGQDVPLAIETLKELSKTHGIILYTMRSGKTLGDAVGWFIKNEIPLSGVNTNPSQTEWTHSPKCYANLYIDDAAFGAPIILPEGFTRPCLDWSKVRDEMAHW